MVRVDNKSLYEPKTIAQEFNKYFTHIGPTLTEKIRKTKSLFTDYLEPLNNCICSDELSPELMFDEFERAFKSVLKNRAIGAGPKLSIKIPNTKALFSDFLLPLDKCVCSDELSSDLSTEELERAFKSIKKNKSRGSDEINGNVIIDCFEQLKDVFFKVFSASIKQGIFPEQLKIAQVTPIYKEGDQSKITNYRPISMLSIFSKVLERIMCNRVYKHLDKNN
ncbi:uncharacterized protein LOC136091937 [Hydra vulgaris]|uniref:Uncharacterized protein LOC136091937 n=1 Tax=Hydra vulgaris TaxID=6087 RepID=A0ABM4DMD5_HYDVU